jgi:hypothetical protein
VGIIAQRGRASAVRKYYICRNRCT